MRQQITNYNPKPHPLSIKCFSDQAASRSDITSSIFSAEAWGKIYGLLASQWLEEGEILSTDPFTLKSFKTSTKYLTNLI